MQELSLSLNYRKYKSFKTFFDCRKSNLFTFQVKHIVELDIFLHLKNWNLRAFKVGCILFVQPLYSRLRCAIPTFHGDYKEPCSSKVCFCSMHLEIFYFKNLIESKKEMFPIKWVITFQHFNRSVIRIMESW